MATSRRKTIQLIHTATQEQPINKAFLQDTMIAIERVNKAEQRFPSRWYKPSSFTCMRQMYFIRLEQPLDNKLDEYNSVGMSKTGTARHAQIQEVLVKMKELGFDWEYVSVADYVKQKQAQGKCMNLVVKAQHGFETRLFDSVLEMSFMCDGIIRRISTNQYYLFEFKNQASFKYKDKEAPDADHMEQVSAYCTVLDLDDVLFLYEHRDLCHLEAFLVKVTPEMKQHVVDKIMLCEEHVAKLDPPPVVRTSKLCRWCKYENSCKKVGD